MNLREQIKNLLVTLWPKSKLPTEVHSEIINRLATARLSMEQIGALLRAHRMECQKASWSPEPSDIHRRILATRSNTGVVARVKSTEETIDADANELRWAKIANTARYERVKAAIECMEMADLDAFVKSKLTGIMDTQAEFAAEMWEWAKEKLGKVETWTPERVANCQPARVVLCRCLGIAIDKPTYDQKRRYPATASTAGFDNSLTSRAIAEIVR